MAEIDPLDRLVQLARQEEPPPSPEATGGIMRRIRAADRPRPAAGTGRWRGAAIILASAAAVVALVFLVGQPHGPSTAPDGGKGLTRTSAPIQDPGAAETIVPALDILGTLESEVDQLMGSAEPQRSPVVKT